MFSLAYAASSQSIPGAGPGRAPVAGFALVLPLLAPSRSSASKGGGRSAGCAAGGTLPGASRGFVDWVAAA
eukprot:1584907-Heterocapsa_arctica.AAC.1